MKQVEMHRACSRQGEIRNAYKILVGKREDRDHSDDRGVNGMILKWILKNRTGISGLDSSGSG
jgi:hypothetical protein